MSWAMIGSAAITTGGSMYAANKAGKGGGGGPSAINVDIPDYQVDPMYTASQEELYPQALNWAKGVSGVNLPGYQQSPYYASSQQQLSELGGGLMSGNLPEWLRPIGQTGSPEFNEMMKLSTRDVTRAVGEDMSRRNVSRGGIGTSAIAKSVADMSSKMRYQDYMRSLEGRESLLGKGIDVAGGTRASGQQESQMQNLFGLDIAKLGLGVRETGLGLLSDVRGSALDLSKSKSAYGLESAKLEADIQAKNAAAQREAETSKNSMWTGILSSTIGTLGNVAGSFGGGGGGTSPLGSAGGGGGSVPSGNLPYNQWSNYNFSAGL